jgi:mycothiol synthase
MSFAFLSRRSREDTSSGLEWIMRPQMPGTDLCVVMLDWAQARTREIAEERQETASLDLVAHEDEAEKRALLEHNGFSLIQDAHNWYMTCPLDGPLSEPELPEGFTIRAVTDENEDDVKAYEVVYGFTPVKRPHRLALLRSPDYRHLVTVAPDGVFVAFCEVSISRKEWKLSGQRIGWVDYVGTHEDFQRQGLGKAMMLAGLHQLQMCGTDRALLITMSSNTAAQNTFKASSFHYKERDFCYKKKINLRQD